MKSSVFIHRRAGTMASFLILQVARQLMIARTTRACSTPVSF